YLAPPRVSGISTEISEAGKPAVISESVAFLKASEVAWIPNTPLFLPDIRCFPLSSTSFDSHTRLHYFFPDAETCRFAGFFLRFLMQRNQQQQGAACSRAAC